jgi:3-hydroxybutyryl-CoA dehydrogenase
MQIVVVADEPQLSELKTKPLREEVIMRFATSLDDVDDKADALFFLKEEDSAFSNIDRLKSFTCPAIVHSVVHTLEELPMGLIRINAWPGFLKRDIMEVSAAKDDETSVRKIFDTLGWKYLLVPDIPGMIAARIISMIVNEAWFALGDEVSDRENIDVAMKLGTNYPYGPFEWGERIGLQNIVHLLRHLARHDERYTPAPLLLNEITGKWQ